MKMSITICGFPMLLLETMKRDLSKYAKCEVIQLGTDVKIVCEADLVKCMEVIAISDKYNFHMDDDYELSTDINAP